MNCRSRSRSCPDVRILPDQVFVLCLTLVLVIALHLFLKYTRLGMSMRAMAENPALARVCGVKTDGIIRWTWVVSGMLAAVAGIFSGLTVQLRPEMGFNLLLAVFTAAILGGAPAACSAQCSAGCWSVSPRTCRSSSSRRVTSPQFRS